MRTDGARSVSVRRWAVCADGSSAFGMDGCRRCGGLDGRRGRHVSGASRGRGGRTIGRTPKPYSSSVAFAGDAGGVVFSSCGKVSVCM